ncbi:MAG: thermostable 8-oxoguanine DNA glycosylase, partial [Rickettsiales bacterium]
CLKDVKNIDGSEANISVKTLEDKRSVKKQKDKKEATNRTEIAKKLQTLGIEPNNIELITNNIIGNQEASDFLRNSGDDLMTFFKNKIEKSIDLKSTDSDSDIKSDLGVMKSKKYDDIKECIASFCNVLNYNAPKTDGTISPKINPEVTKVESLVANDEQKISRG